MSQAPISDIIRLFERLLDRLSRLPSDETSERRQEEALKGLSEWLRDTGCRFDDEYYFNAHFDKVFGDLINETKPAKIRSKLDEYVRRVSGEKGFPQIQKTLESLHTEAGKYIRNGKMDWKVKLAWLTVACVVLALGAGALVGAKLWLEDARRNKGRPAEARGGGSGVLPTRAAPRRPTGRPAVARDASAQTRDEPHVLSLIVPVRQGAFLDDLKPDRLGPEDARALRGNCTWIWYDTQREYEQTKIAELLGASADRPADDVFDVRCVVLFLPAGDHRLSAKATALEQHQAFADLSKTGLAVRVSPPFPIELIRDLPFHRA